MALREPIVVNERIVVPEGAIEVRAVASSGPGGQNANKVASKIQMRIDLAQIGLTPDELERVRRSLSSRVDADGRLLVVSQATRDQEKNARDAGEKAAALIRAALVRPKTRRMTRPTKGSKERRQVEKRRRSQRLKERRVGDDF